MSKHKLVPVEPTEAMIDAARDQHEGQPYLPVSLYKAMLAAAPAVQGEPVYWLVRNEFEGYMQFHDHPPRDCDISPYGLDEIIPLYAAPQPAPDVAGLVDTVDEGVPDYINAAIGNLEHDNYELSYAGYLERKRDAELIRAHIARAGQTVTELQAELARELQRRFDGNEQASREHRADVSALVEARELLLIFRGVIGGATWTLDDEDKELAVRVEKAVTALATHKDSLTVQPNPPDVAGLVEALERFIEAWTECQQQPVHAEEFEILTDICEDSLKALAAYRKQQESIHDNQ